MRTAPNVQRTPQWDRRDRELLGELPVAHLESEPAGLGANWKGRTTKLFGAAGGKPQAAEGRGVS